MAHATLSRIALVSSSESLLDLRDAWDSLVSRLVEPPVFMSFTWIWHAWTTVAEPRGRRLRVVTAWIDERLVLVLPLMIDNRVLRMISSETLEYRDAIVEPGDDGAAWVRAAWAFARASASVDAFVLSNLRDPSPMASLLRGLPGARPVGGGWCPVIRLDRYTAWEGYARSVLRPSLLSDQRRQWKRLRHALPGLRFEHVVEPAQIKATLDWIGRHKVAWSQARDGRVVWHANPDVRRFLDGIASAQWASGHLVLVILSNDATVVSAGLGYTHHGHFLFHAFAYDAAFATFSPSRLLLESLLRWCFESGVRTFDFMPGEEAYKRQWATDFVRTDSFFGALSFRGRCLQALSNLRPAGVAVTAWVRPIYARLPARPRAWLRGRLTTLRTISNALQLAPPTDPRAQARVASHQPDDAAAAAPTSAAGPT